MTTSQGLLEHLFPEIYPIIAAHLPLYATPSTLLALALTNHHISEIARPLVYSRLVLKNETDAMLALQKLLDNPPLGRAVRELHIMSELSLDTRNQDPPSDVIKRLEEVISSGCLPFIHTLGLHVTEGWYYDTERNFQPVNGFGKFRKAFSADLNVKCPRLRGLILKGFTESTGDPWIEDSGILHLPGITGLSICFEAFTLHSSASDKLLEHISALSGSLHTLDLGPGSLQSISTSPIFELHLPVLRSLSLSSFTEVDTVRSMAFFERHPSIEYLNIASNLIGNNRWFPSELSNKFLPNLLHLRACWTDVRLLAPILHQLLSLSIHKSVNAQIPYLLRFVLPNGLPILKSLDIGQSLSSSNKNKTIEGSLWHESEDGQFQQAKTKKESRSVYDSFMHSIVRAAPNLEELAFHGSLFQLSDFISIADDFNGFLHLEHLYYEGSYYNMNSYIAEERDAFATHATDLAEVVPRLASITNVANLRPPYLTARIRRNGNGEVTGVEIGKGYGMKLGYEDEAFPWAPRDPSD